MDTSYPKETVQIESQSLSQNNYNYDASYFQGIYPQEIFFLLH